MAIKFVDIFSGPGGLNEGFASLNDSKHEPVFQSTIAAEMDKDAVMTLRLRKFYRECLRTDDLDNYFDYVLGEKTLPYDSKNATLWKLISHLTPQVTLGDETHNEHFDKLLQNTISRDDHWVLLGGPPCQAYSKIGRWRYRTENGYDLSDDHRAHLYKEYLRVLSKFGPSVFVMENVTGLLSSPFFDKIIEDLMKIKVNGCSYLVYSLTVPLEKTKSARDYVVKSEDYGLPQARHRVILLGVRTDIKNIPATLDKRSTRVAASDVLGSLPKLRSGFSKDTNDDNSWLEYVQKSGALMAKKYGFSDEKYELLKQSSNVYLSSRSNIDVVNFITENPCKFLTNHVTRGHIKGDVQRYLFSALFCKIKGQSPKAKDFPVDLIPQHKNWDSGHFKDRFRVIRSQYPAPTVTSHISKDGHAYIHYDPTQARSLTVREAARLQTFPDNYFFSGPRTAQYRQVGNAVPPYLAKQIAKIVADLLTL